MPLLESDAQVVRRELERVLASPGFARNKRSAIYCGLLN
jgi:hypothetical protein